MRARSVISPLILLFIGVQLAAAQADVYTRSFPNSIPPLYSCTTGSIYSQCSFSVGSANPGDLTASGAASATLGGALRSEISASAAGGAAGSLKAELDAAYYDQLTVIGASPGSTITFFADFSGSAGANSLSPGASYITDVGLQLLYGTAAQGPYGCFYCLVGPAFGFDNVAMQVVTNTVSSDVMCCIDREGGTDLAGALNNTYQLTFPVIDGPATLYFELYSFLQFAGPQPLTGNVSVDFSSTGELNGVVVRDADGNDITHDVVITSAYDIAYPLGAPTVTPELPSLILLSTGGFILLIGAARRQRPGLGSGRGVG